VSSRWSADPSAPRGEAYDERFTRLAASGQDVHGEASFVERWLHRTRPDGAPWRVLDAGCGTGRVALELARRGIDIVGVDLDPGMLEAARQKAPERTWVAADLATLDLGPSERFDAVVLAGNVLIFVEPGTETAVVAACARHLRPSGLLIAGFQVRPDGYDPGRLDGDAAGAGLELVARYATWDEGPWPADGTYQVSVHRARP
jgi:2-polyprenyl-3-methyl-5-hydroxy-6-metoxy-1,4-benzoquinol methylase